MALQPHLHSASGPVPRAPRAAVLASLPFGTQRRQLQAAVHGQGRGLLVTKGRGPSGVGPAEWPGLAAQMGVLARPHACPPALPLTPPLVPLPPAGRRLGCAGAAATAFPRSPFLQPQAQRGLGRGKPPPERGLRSLQDAARKSGGPGGPPAVQLLSAFAGSPGG